MAARKRGYPLCHVAGTRVTLDRMDRSTGIWPNSDRGENALQYCLDAGKWPVSGTSTNHHALGLGEGLIRQSL